MDFRTAVMSLLLVFVITGSWVITQQITQNNPIVAENKNASIKTAVQDLGTSTPMEQMAAVGATKNNHRVSR